MSEEENGSGTASISPPEDSKNLQNNTTTERNSQVNQTVWAKLKEKILSYSMTLSWSRRDWYCQAGVAASRARTGDEFGSPTTWIQDLVRSVGRGKLVDNKT